MAPKNPNAVYVVFRGKKPGIYQSLEECDEQVTGYSKARHHKFNGALEADLAWKEWQRKITTKIMATAPQENVARPWAGSVHSPAPRIELSPAGQQTSNLAKPGNGSWQSSQPSPQSTAFFNDHPLALPQIPSNSNFQRTADPTNLPLTYQTPSSFVDLSTSSSPAPCKPTLKRPASFNTPPSSSPPSRHAPNLQTSRCIDLTDEPDSPEPDAKRLKMEASVKIPEVLQLTAEERFELRQLDRQVKPTRTEEKLIELSPEQEKAVNMALRKNNIFLTGAAGCGKTVTLQEILRRLQKKKRGGNVQVVAPTGIAALPLDGKTTYSFAGWNPDSFRNGIEELLKKTRPGTVKAIDKLDVLIIEEISMVENQFLERLNLLFQYVLKNKLPFGGKQVIFLGDFHQLPPVKAFEHCLQCGESIPVRLELVCVSQKCKGREDHQTFQKGDKWAFKAPVWRELKLRHVKLEQIHRQKDTRFQDILNKIRNGHPLSAQEWADLERPKQLPRSAHAVRLMSRLTQVKAFNENQLAGLKSQPKTWRAFDSCKKLIPQDYYDPVTALKMQEYKESLKEHRFPVDLTLKVGSQVVLLHNMDHERGLVNGSQGVVIGFQKATQELEKILDQSGEHQAFRHDSMLQYHTSNIEWRPLVRFTNGSVELIPAIATASFRGPADPLQQYTVCRTQVPLTLAWALSIHKSQGMTLEYVEVSSRDIFESGQLYVALSRATHLEGLRVTGFSRNQLPMDPTVLEFYTSTKWEKLLPRRKKKVAA